MLVMVEPARELVEKRISIARGSGMKSKQGINKVLLLLERVYVQQYINERIMMTPDKFNQFMDYVIEKHILEVMYSKSAEYARGDDKLYNFYRAAEMSGKTPIECLRGMKLKHDVSIDDMLNDLLDPTQIEHTQERWQEKLSDDINYLFLLWALLAEKHGWKIPSNNWIAGENTEPINWENKDE